MYIADDVPDALRYKTVLGRSAGVCRRAHDPLEDFYEPRAAATALVGDLVRCKGKVVLDPLLQRIASVLEAYQQAPSLETARQKDGALCALGAIADELQSRNNWAPLIAALLATHVLPDLEQGSPFGILRCRACEPCSASRNILQ